MPGQNVSSGRRTSVGVGHRLAAYVFVLFVSACGIAYALDNAARLISAEATTKPVIAAVAGGSKIPAEIEALSRVLNSDQWYAKSRSQKIKSSKAIPPATVHARDFKSNRSGVTRAPQSYSGPFAAMFGGYQNENALIAPPVTPVPVAGYRTVCVRMCDGFYYPISFSTTESRFAKDELKCQASCASPAKLFVYRNPGGDIAEMEDLSGKPYSQMENAYAYRTNYSETCTCKVQPWQQEAKDRHRLYALQTAKKKGDKTVVAELQELKSKVDAIDRSIAETKRLAGVVPTKKIKWRGRDPAVAVASAQEQGAFLATSSAAWPPAMQLGTTPPPPLQPKLKKSQIQAREKSRDPTPNDLLSAALR